MRLLWISLHLGGHILSSRNNLYRYDIYKNKRAAHDCFMLFKSISANQLQELEVPSCCFCPKDFFRAYTSSPVSTEDKVENWPVLKALILDYKMQLAIKTSSLQRINEVQKKACNSLFINKKEIDSEVV